MKSSVLRTASPETETGDTTNPPSWRRTVFETAALLAFIIIAASFL